LSKNDIDLLSPGDPSDVPQEVWEQGRDDQYQSDYIDDLHRLHEEEELLASLRQEPELRAKLAAQIAEIEPHSSQQVSLKYRSKLKQQVFLALMEKAAMKNPEVCKWLDSHWEDDLPYGKPFITAYKGKQRTLLQSLISKVRADLWRRSRRPLP
jgi:hypothetical protein